MAHSGILSRDLIDIYHISKDERLYVKGMKKHPVGWFLWGMYDSMKIGLSEFIDIITY